MGGWITINGTHVLVKDGESVEDAMARQFRESSHKGVIESSKAKINDAIKNSKTISSNLRNEIQAKVGRYNRTIEIKNYVPEKREVVSPDGNKSIFVDDKVVRACEKNLSGDIETKNNGVVRVRKTAIFETGFEHIANIDHDLTPFDIEQVRSILKEPDEFVKSAKGRDTYIKHGKFGKRGAKPYMVVHIGKDKNNKSKDCVITAYTTDAIDNFK